MCAFLRTDLDVGEDLAQPGDEDGDEADGETVDDEVGEVVAGDAGRGTGAGD